MDGHTALFGAMAMARERGRATTVASSVIDRVGDHPGFVQAPEPGDYRYSRTGEVLRCPWHGWEFDVKSGQSWIDPAGVRVRRYAVRVEGGAALAGCGAQVPDPHKGPYIAETYPVSIAEQYVIVAIDA